MNPNEFKTALEAVDIKITDKQMQQFRQYYELLVEWNEKINLTAITDQEEVYLKHFYDSATLGIHIDFSQSGQTLVDVGSGAGFPSLPLKILFPSLQVTIIDSLNKRIKFIDEVVNQLGLVGVEAVHGRAEDIGQNKKYREQFDFATARAVARLGVLAEFCLPLVKKNGQFIAMKASKTDEEAADAKKAIATLGGEFMGDIVFNLPENAGERHILRIVKTKETPKKFPRKAGTPAKKPIQ